MLLSTSKKNRLLFTGMNNFLRSRVMPYYCSFTLKKFNIVLIIKISLRIKHSVVYKAVTNAREKILFMFH